ncbi:MAG: hypothetical protein R2708_28470 [Vicinamibacterales bacterium]
MLLSDQRTMKSENRAGAHQLSVNTLIRCPSGSVRPSSASSWPPSTAVAAGHRRAFGAPQLFPPMVGLQMINPATGELITEFAPGLG